uniref:Uridine kinase n=1 Tax=uncultured bacterium contig00007 TaxID=1181499 RepID=A0A806K271_9BACT|nr:uridine kinase [uncultured bacterium contig00007]
MNTIKINFANTQKSAECPYGTKASDLIENFGIPADEIAAVRVNNEIRPLGTSLLVNANVEPVLLDSRDGAMIYRRTLSFVLAIAARNIFPHRGVHVGHSLGHSYYYTFNDDEKCEKEDVQKLAAEMEKLVKEDLPIAFKYLAWEEAMELLKFLHQADTALLLEQRSSPRIKVNECQGYVDIYVQPLLAHTGQLYAFELMHYQDGFLLRFPGIGSKSLGAFADEPNLFKIYNDYKKWGRMIGVRVVGELNSKISNRTVREYIRIAEAHQARKLSDIAEQIAKRRDSVKMVLIAGPSSSGKTTSAKRLSLELMVMGFKPIAISLDDYYRGTEHTPKDEKGEPDYECLEALDVPYLNEQLQSLYRGEEIQIPVYDFKTGERSKAGGKKIRLEKENLLIVEGIHGLNDALTHTIERSTKFKVYISPLTQLNLDDHNRIPTSDNRLLRRMVRDSQFRGMQAAGTIRMWPKVQAGERKYIFPFQEGSDAAFNSSLDYELSVLKYYADPLLRAVKPNMHEYAEAVRLLSFLENFAPILPQHVPGTSILREFIGDSEFKY